MRKKLFWAGAVVLVVGGVLVGRFAPFSDETIAAVVPTQAEKPILLAQANMGTPAVHPALWVQENDRILGDPNAPVTLIEYSSMTCPHCGTFHNDYLPDIEKDLIETGKVKFIMRHLPWDNMAMGIAKVTFCAPKDQYYMLLKGFYRTQREWLQGMDPLAEIKKIARFGGLDSAAVDACIQDPAVHAELLKIKETAREDLKLNATPSFFVNGERLDRIRNFSQVKEALETALEQVKQRG